MSEHIIITRNGSVATVKGPAEIFTGDVNVAFCAPAREGSCLSGGLVTFQPRARTNWHTHPFGQLLIIVEGHGRVQEWGEKAQDVYPGDLVWFPAGIKHWHGGALDSLMRHYALQEEKDGSAAQWLEPVSDVQYAGQPG